MDLVAISVESDRGCLGLPARTRTRVGARSAERVEPGRACLLSFGHETMGSGLDERLAVRKRAAHVVGERLGG